MRRIWRRWMAVAALLLGLGLVLGRPAISDAAPFDGELDKQRQQALKTIADHIATADPQRVDACLQQVGFGADRTAAVTDWQAMSAARKIETAYHFAEQAGRENGRTFLRLLARTLSRDYPATAEHDDLLFLSEGDTPAVVQFGVAEHVRLGIPADPAVRRAVTAMGDIVGYDGPLSPDRLLTVIGMPEESRYSLLRKVGTDSEKLMAALDQLPAAQQRESLARWLDHVYEVHPETKSDAVLAAIRKSLGDYPDAPPAFAWAREPSPDPYRPGPAGDAAPLLRDQLDSVGTTLSVEGDLGAVARSGANAEELAKQRTLASHGAQLADGAPVTLIVAEPHQPAPRDVRHASPAMKRYLADTVDAAFPTGVPAERPIAIHFESGDGTIASRSLVLQAGDVGELRRARAAFVRGGMVYLDGGRVFVSDVDGALALAKLDVCADRLCLRFDAAAQNPSGRGETLDLPFQPSPLFWEIWDRVHDRSIDAFYLSINPTRAALTDDFVDRVPTDKLHADSPDPVARRYEVVTAGDITRSRIGHVLYEADVLFKSAGLGFDVTAGRSTKNARLPFGADAFSLDRSDAVEEDVSYKDRWCRFYWSSGDINLSVNGADNILELTGAPVRANAEAMRRKGADLVPFPQGGWCGGAKREARALNRIVDHPGTGPEIVRQLIDVARIQAFVKWAREAGLATTKAFDAAQTHKPLPEPAIPHWTSGVRSDPITYVQLENKGTLVLHVHAGDVDAANEALHEEWTQQLAELPALGLRFNGQKWICSTCNVRKVLGGWMQRLEARLAERLHATIVDAADPSLLFDDGDLPQEQDASVKMHALPYNVHGGVLLEAMGFGKSRQAASVSDPYGRPVMRTVTDGIHFWSVGEGAFAAEHVFFRDARIIGQYADRGHRRFLLASGKRGAAWYDARLRSTKDFPSGLEWRRVLPVAGTAERGDLYWRDGVDSSLRHASLSMADVQASVEPAPLPVAQSQLVVTRVPGTRDRFVVDVYVPGALARLEALRVKVQQETTDAAAGTAAIRAFLEWGYYGEAKALLAQTLPLLSKSSVDATLLDRFGGLIQASSLSEADQFLSATLVIGGLLRQLDGAPNVAKIQQTTERIAARLDGLPVPLVAAVERVLAIALDPGSTSRSKQLRTYLTRATNEHRRLANGAIALAHGGLGAPL